MKTIIYGTGKWYREYRDKLPKDLEIVAYADSNEEKATSNSGELFEGKPIVSPKELDEIEFDCVWICADMWNSSHIFRTLVDGGVTSDKIFMLCRLCIPELTWAYHATDDKKGYVSKVNGLVLNERTITDFEVTREIILHKDYEVLLPYDNWVVIDIGMNVGGASLWFAQKEQVKKVYSYEPFPDTYKQAMENLKMNDKRITDKIQTNNIGLLDANIISTIPINDEETGRRNVFGKGVKQKLGCVEIECRDVVSELQCIFKENDENTHYFVKMDTEGSEFPIMRALDQSVCLDNIEVIAMEYHNDPSELIDILRKHGFKVMKKYETSDRKPQGILYAIK